VTDVEPGCELPESDRRGHAASRRSRWALTESENPCGAPARRLRHLLSDPPGRM